jgi:hypothetical protein
MLDYYFKFDPFKHGFRQIYIYIYNTLIYEYLWLRIFHYLLSFMIDNFSKNNIFFSEGRTKI